MVRATERIDGASVTVMMNRTPSCERDSLAVALPDTGAQIAGKGAVYFKIVRGST